MPLKYYVPISIGVFILAILVARYLSLPVVPFALILLVGETLIGLQVEHQKVSNFLEDLLRAMKSSAKPH
jgi:hypothetical protein